MFCALIRTDSLTNSYVSQFPRCSLRNLVAVSLFMDLDKLTGVMFVLKADAEMFVITKDLKAGLILTVVFPTELTSTSVL